MPKDTLRVVARITARPERVDDVRALLSELIEPTRKEAGCIRYELLQNKSDPTDFTFVEEWENDDALDAHAASEHIKQVASRLTDLITGAPDIRKYFLVQ
jgi:quinol monooxygenase YgiN